MKHGLMIFLLLVLTGITAAQPGGKGREGILEFRTELELDSLQIEQIKTIQQTYRLKILEAKQSEPDNREQIRNIRREQVAKIESVLTAGQVSKWRTLRRSGPGNRNNEGLKQALHQYRSTEIIPVLLKYRSVFEKKLSQSEKEIISDWRARADAFRKAMKQQPLREEHRERAKAFRMQLRAGLDPVVNAHRDELSDILNELKPRRDQWQKDMEAIRLKHGRTKGRPTPYSRDSNQKDEHFMIRFLLLNTETEPEGIR